MRVMALIEGPAVIERILFWLGLWHPLPACGPSPPSEHASLPLASHPVPDVPLDGPGVRRSRGEQDDAGDDGKTRPLTIVIR
jgi:hypothetical protein